MRFYNFATHAKNKFSQNKISFRANNADRQTIPFPCPFTPNRKPYVQVERTAFTES